MDDTASHHASYIILHATVDHFWISEKRSPLTNTSKSAREQCVNFATDWILCVAYQRKPILKCPKNNYKKTFLCQEEVVEIYLFPHIWLIPGIVVEGAATGALACCPVSRVSDGDGLPVVLWIELQVHAWTKGAISGSGLNFNNFVDEQFVGKLDIFPSSNPSHVVK